MNILAVDDERLALSGLELAIRQARPEAAVYPFRTAREALDFAAKTHCEVAFLDIALGEMSGLELARHLKELDAAVNIIFVTGYSEYMGEAFSLHVSGYVTKPATPELIDRELENLRHPLPQSSGLRARARTFGNFEFYIDDQPVRFNRSRSKELLAYLIDRQGAACNTAELCAALFEDEAGTVANRSLCRTLLSDLTATLRRHDLEPLLLKGRNSFAIAPQLLDCDLYRFYNGDAAAVNAYAGEYMSQYSWAEMRNGRLGRDR